MTEPWGGPPFGYDPIARLRAEREGQRWARKTIRRIRRELRELYHVSKPSQRSGER